MGNKTLSGNSYYDLIQIPSEEIYQTKGFLPDYHTLLILERLSGIDKVDIARVLTHIANVLRLARDYNLSEVNFLTFKVVREDNKFVIPYY